MCEGSQIPATPLYLASQCHPLSRMPAMALDRCQPRATPLKGSDCYPSEDSTTHESRSPYPPSTSPSDSESASDGPYSFPKNYRLHTSISTVPAMRLREIVIKLVDLSPGFQHAVAKELLSAPNSSQPGSPMRRRRSRKTKRPDSSDTIVPDGKRNKCGKHVRCKTHQSCGETRAFHPGKAI